MTPVTTPRSSAGDPARTLRLLWRDTAATPRRGPQRALDLDAVVAAATGLADAEGLDAVTMRRLAEELGVGAMTLYTYVPGKAELLDLMLDAAYGEMERADTTDRHWRERVTSVADENRALFTAHPWAAAVSTLRPPLGPGLMAKYEHELAALDGIGLGDVEMDDCLTLVLTFVQASARDVADSRAARQQSAMDDEQWWAANADLLARLLDPGTYPLAGRVGSAAGAAHGSAHDPEHAYRFGLERLLDGIAGLVEVRNASRRADRPAAQPGPPA